MKYRLFVESSEYLYLLNPMSLDEIKEFVVENEFPSILFSPTTKEIVSEILVGLYKPFLEEHDNSIQERFKPFFERFRHVLNFEASTFVPFESDEYDIRPNELFTFYVSNQSIPLIITTYDVLNFRDALSAVEEHGEIVELPISEFFVDSFSENNNQKSEREIPLVLKVVNEDIYSYIILDGFRVVEDIRDSGMETMKIKLLSI
jgi:hypothetical protein